MANDSKRVTYICSKCGSTNVVSDTRAEWDVDNQVWLVVGHYDSSECLDCEEEESLIEVELAPASA
jgi:peptide subunit release factor 1 (eRF1)